MIEVTNITEQKEIDEKLIDARFSEIIQNIDAVESKLTPEELFEIELTPVSKAPGTSDQGYRYD